MGVVIELQFARRATGRPDAKAGAARCMRQQTGRLSFTCGFACIILARTVASTSVIFGRSRIVIPAVHVELLRQGRLTWGWTIDTETGDDGRTGRPSGQETGSEPRARR
jgi:hypothetical protein